MNPEPVEMRNTYKMLIGKKLKERDNLETS
jgi:hypothetical protein